MAGSIEEQLNLPALDPPPGVTPVFNPNADLPWFVPATVIITVIPGLLVLLRLYTKIRIVRKTDITEYIILLGFAGFLVLVVLGHVAKHAGAGQHQWNLYRRDLNNTLYWFNILEIVYCPTIFMVKLAILLQYLHLLVPNGVKNRVLTIGVWVLIGTNLVFYIVSASISGAACEPREKIWNDLVPGTCLNNNLMIIITSIWNVLSDIAILVLPAHAVWKLKMPMRRKLQITSLFAIGLLTIIANALIIMYLLDTNGDDADASYYLLFVGVWAAVEIAIGLLVVSVLTLPKVLDATWHRFYPFLSRSFSNASSGIRSLFNSMGTQRGGTTVDTAKPDSPLMTDPSATTLDLQPLSRDGSYTGQPEHVTSKAPKPRVSTS